MLPQSERRSFRVLSILLLPRAKSASAANRSGGSALGGSLELAGNLIYKSGSPLSPEGWGVRVTGDEEPGAACCRGRRGFSIHLGSEVYAGPTYKACRGHKEPEEITRVMLAFLVKCLEAAFDDVLAAPNVLYGGSASCLKEG